MGILDSVGGFFDDYGNTISTVGSLGLGTANYLNAKEAQETASSYYDAASATTEERWNWWKENMAPLEVARSDKELADLEFTEEQRGTLEDYAEQDLAYMGQMRDLRGELLPQQKELYKRGLGLQSAKIDATMGDIEQYQQNREVEQRFYDQATEGLNPQQEAGRAATDVAQAYKQAEGENRRSAARMGLNPNSGAYAESMNDNSLSKARDITAAKTGARERAEDTNFSRLSSAVNARQRLGPASTNISRPGLGLNYAGSNFNSGRAANTGQPNPANTYAQLGNVASRGAQGGMQSSGYWLNQGLNSLSNRSS